MLNKERLEELKFRRHFSKMELIKVDNIISRKQKFRPCFLEAYKEGPDGELINLSLEELVIRKKELVNEIEEIDRQLKELE